MNEGSPAGNGSSTVRLFQRTFSSLRNRNYRLFFIGQLISLTGSWMQRTAEGWLIYQLTGSKLLLGWVSALSFAPMFFLSTLGGAVADRYPKRPLLIATQLAAIFPAVAMAVLITGHWIQVWHIMVLAAVSGVVMAFDMPTRQAFVVEMVGEEDLLNAIALNSTIFNGARIVGPAAAGYLMGKLGVGPCYWLNGISFLAVVVGLYLMRLPQHVPTKIQESPWEHALGGFRYLRGDVRLLALIAMVTIIGIFGFSYQVLMPAIARDVYRVREQGYGMLVSAGGLGAIVGSLLMAGMSERVDRKKMILAGALLFSISILVLTLFHSYTTALFCLAGAGFGLIVFFSTANTLIQLSVPDDVRGRIMGVWSLVIGGIVPLGSLQAGTVSHYLGVNPALQLSAAVCFLTAAGGIWGLIVKRRTSAT